MMRSDVEGNIRRFIIEDVLEVGEDHDLPQDLPLISGLLDSFGLMSLISYIEDEYGVAIRNDQVVRKHFESVQTLAALVEELRRDGGPASEPGSPGSPPAGQQAG